MTVVKITTSYKKSPLPRLFAAAAMAGVVITGVSCSGGSSTAQVCLYEDANYKGTEICYKKGSKSDSLSSSSRKKVGNTYRTTTKKLSDKVSSLKFKGDNVTAKLYYDADYKGTEVVYTEDTPNIKAEHNNKFSSIKVD